MHLGMTDCEGADYRLGPILHQEGGRKLQSGRAGCPNPYRALRQGWGNRAFRTCHAGLPRAKVRRSIVLHPFDNATLPNLFPSHALKGFHL